MRYINHIKSKKKMGLTKTENFDENILLFSDLLKAISHPARLTILKYLIDNPGCICNDIVANLPLTQSTVSQHLKELKQVGLIKGEIFPPKTCYCINEEVWFKFKTTFSDFFEAFKPTVTQNCNDENCC